ncbi:hypothetical protein BHE74_00015865 [Ensete ventricosum]|uniref:Uncharacterized protein n=1 Tax=Ensete ventricosum TaxID=4639 RepID=A0A426ZUX7_ENSVE|nr:hypothetical protein B296_00038945 [Ensete ventricosum]RWW76067.1 hypothetical protein BHE74_00015865 [Ensete ventricosum]RZR89418.1 hypothetical protein BHM03_00017141 [Ensete ventricosum]
MVNGRYRGDRKLGLVLVLSYGYTRSLVFKHEPPTELQERDAVVAREATLFHSRSLPETLALQPRNAN